MADTAELAALAAALVDPGGTLTPAALHGAVCGFAVLDNPGFPFDGLLAIVAQDVDMDPALLEQFVETTRSGLAADDLGFALLLPDDETAAVEERLAALGDWCGSFLNAFGVALGNAVETGLLDADEFELPAELQEIVDDMTAIAEVAPDSVNDPDEFAEGADDVEAQLVELEEFVKVGVLLIMSVMARDDTDPDF